MRTYLSSDSQIAVQVLRQSPPLGHLPGEASQSHQLNELNIMKSSLVSVSSALKGKYRKKLEASK